MFLPTENALDRDDDTLSEEVYRSEQCETPLLSITIPTFNRPDLLVEAVRSALEQDCCYPFEIVVLDDDPQSLGHTPLLAALPSLALINF